MRSEWNHGFAPGASPTDDTCLHDKQANGRSRPWRRNRLMANALAVAYDELGPEYAKYSERVSKCAPELKFEELPDGTRRLTEAYFCHCRLCPMCQWRKARMLHKQVCEVVDAHWNGIPEKPEIRDEDNWVVQSYRPAIKGRKSDRVLLLTLTVRNPKADDLSATIKHMSKAWKLLGDDDKFKASVKGWFRALEVTYNKEADTYHPHYHVLLMVRGDYFDTRKNWYISHENWKQLWQRVLGVDYEPSVYINSVNGKKGAQLTEETRKELHEATKYATKPQDMYKLAPDGAEVPSHIVKSMHDSLKGKRLLGWGGTFKQLRAQLMQPDVENPNTDLTDKGEIPAGTEPVAVHVYRWAIGPTSRQDYYLYRSHGSQRAA